MLIIQLIIDILDKQSLHGALSSMRNKLTLSCEGFKLFLFQVLFLFLFYPSIFHIYITPSMLIFYRC